MRVEGEKRFEAPLATVWRALNSPESMAKTMPGVEGSTSTTTATGRRT